MALLGVPQENNLDNNEGVEGASPPSTPSFGNSDKVFKAGEGRVLLFRLEGDSKSNMPAGLRDGVVGLLA